MTTEAVATDAEKLSVPFRWRCPQCNYSVTPNEIFSQRKHFDAHALECVRCLYRTETKLTWQEAKEAYTRPAPRPADAGVRLEARPADDSQDWTEIFPVQLEWVAKSGHQVRAIETPSVPTAAGEPEGRQALLAYLDIFLHPNPTFDLSGITCKHGYAIEACTYRECTNPMAYETAIKRARDFIALPNASAERAKVVEAQDDLVSHRDAWRSAISAALGRSADQSDDESYWRHELQAFDRTFAALSPDAGMKP